jgi:hypothetical protein
MLSFNPAKHAYTNQLTGEDYISVTTLLSKFKKQFDSHSISERIAKRDGGTPEEIRAKWAQQNEESKKYGSLIHSIIEKYNKTQTITEGYESLIEAYKNFGLIQKTDQILSEEQLYSHTHKLAGTADIIRLEEKGGFSIFDIKTNKRFNFYSQYNEKLLYPVEHLSACEYTSYSLQLSLYGYMFEGISGRKLNQLGIIYYDRNVNKFTFYPVIYMKTDILRLLEYYRTLVYAKS